MKNGVHDPTIIQVDNEYYLVSTDTGLPSTKGIPLRYSTDLVNWEFNKTIFKGIPSIAKEWTNAKGLWAPEIIYVDKEYRIYYSASTFGSSTSMIGLATASHPLSEWTDQGIVVKTNADIASHNAIDANICDDEVGNQWMVYGSFFSGIYIVRLDKETGKCLEKGDYGKQIALRPLAVEGAIEGPYIVYNEETNYYYLFVSFDSLSDSYHIRVARSKKIDGPYEDFTGKSMLDLQSNPNEIGFKLLGSYQWIGEDALYAPGHNSIFYDQLTQQQFVVHHIRRAPFTEDFYMQIRPLFWLSDGWPVIGWSDYDGEVKVIAIDSAKNQSKQWQIVIFNSDSKVIEAEKMTEKDGFLFDCLGVKQINLKENIIIYENKAGEIGLTGRLITGQTFIGKIL